MQIFLVWMVLRLILFAYDLPSSSVLDVQLRNRYVEETSISRTDFMPSYHVFVELDYY